MNAAIPGQARSNSSLSTWLLCVFAVSLLTPRIAFWEKSVLLACALLFWLSTGKAFWNALLRHRLVLLPALCVAVGFVYRIIGWSSALWGNYALLLIMFVAYWAGYYAWNFMEAAQRRKVLVVVFLTFAVNLLDQFRLSLLNPEMQVYLARYGAYGKVNFGLTDFICCIMVFSLFLVADFVNGRPDNPGWKRGLYASLVALTVVYFFSCAQSATITLCFLFATVLFLIAGNAQPGDKGLFLRLLAAAFVFSILAAIAPMALSWGVDFLEPIAGDKILTRLQTIQHLTENNLDTSDLTILTRRDLLSLDIDSWLSSPMSFLVGKGYHNTGSLNVMELAKESGAGNHSGYVDILPRYGVLGFAAIVAMTVFLWKYFLAGCDKRCSVKLKIFLLTLVFYNVANKIFHANVVFSIMFLLPFLRQKPYGRNSSFDKAPQWSPLSPQEQEEGGQVLPSSTIPEEDR